MQVLASLKVEQQKPDEALQHLRDSMKKWFPSLQRMLADSDSEKDEEEKEKEMEEEEQDLDAQLPSFEFRFETAKLLIELDETTEKAVLVSWNLASAACQLKHRQEHLLLLMHLPQVICTSLCLLQLCIVIPEDWKLHTPSSWACTPQQQNLVCHPL